MEIEFWGVRGTFPVAGQSTEKFGGNTACASLSVSGEERVIIDAGTGIRDLGRKLEEEAGGGRLHLHLLLTHFHLDHVMGLPFFGPLNSDRAMLTFYCDEEPEEAERLLGTLMSGRLFPVGLSEMRSTRHFHKLPPGGMELCGLKVRTHRLNHPQGCLAFRLECRGKSAVFATDTEHPLKGLDEPLADFCRGADHLVYDATFTPEEYEAGRRGWGHSTWEAGTRLARAAEVGRLYLSHLNPDFSDRQVERIVRRARKNFSRTSAAREGMKIRT